MIKIDLKAKGKFCKPTVCNDSCSFILPDALCVQKYFFFT